MWCKHAGSAIDAIRINAVSREVRDGRALLIKRRRIASAPLVRTANLFFRAARHPVFVWADAGQWQRWEVNSFNLLHAKQYCAFPNGSRTVCADILPGLSLAEHFVNGTFQSAMLDAAAAELRRAHLLHSNFFDGPWSHGDPNLANFLYSTQENHARLIDFEVVHERRLPPMARHVEDVLSFLQDLLGCAPREPGFHQPSAFWKPTDATGRCGSRSGSACGASRHPAHLVVDSVPITCRWDQSADGSLGLGRPCLERAGVRRMPRDERHRAAKQRLARLHPRPRRCAGGMRQRDQVELPSHRAWTETRADDLVHAGARDEVLDGQPPHRDDEFGLHQKDFPAQPLRAVFDFGRVRHPVTASRVAARETTADGGHVNMGAEHLFRHAGPLLEPTEQALPGRPCKGPSEHRLPHARSLAHEQHPAQDRPAGDRGRLHLRTKPAGEQPARRVP